MEDQLIRQISYGPEKVVMSYNGIIVNGYRFHTKEYGRNKATMNSGVCVRGSLYGENDLDYYGILEEILELSYLGYHNKVYLLRCHWFDPINGIKVDERYGLVDVNHRSRLNSNEPFVLAEQAQQVYYTRYPLGGGRVGGELWAACKVRPKLFVAETLKAKDDEWNDLSGLDYYQEDEPLTTHTISAVDEMISLFDANALMQDVDINEINIPMDNSEVNQFIDDNEESDINESLDDDEDLYDSDLSSGS